MIKANKVFKRLKIIIYLMKTNKTLFFVGTIYNFIGHQRKITCFLEGMKQFSQHMERHYLNNFILDLRAIILVSFFAKHTKHTMNFRIIQCTYNVQEQRMILDILSTDSSSTSIHVHKSYISNISIYEVMDNDVIKNVCMNMINVKTLHLSFPLNCRGI